jgi:hypothetical protein
MRDDLETDELVLEARLIRALETPPQLAIPDGFAVRVAALGRMQTPAFAPAWPVRFGSHRVGSLVMRGALAILILAMLLFAPWAGHRSVVASTLEYAFAFEFVALTVWMCLRQQSAR